MKTPNLVVRNGYGRYYSQEYLYMLRTSDPDGVLINGVVADAVESKVVMQSESIMVHGMKYATFADRIIESLQKSPPTQTVTLPKMTKATATALESYPMYFSLEGNEWEIAGYALNKTLVNNLKGDKFFGVSSGVIYGMCNNSVYGVKVLKGEYVILTKDDEIFVCKTMEL